jgi:serine O-acetyltransferase
MVFFILIIALLLAIALITLFILVFRVQIMTLFNTLIKDIDNILERDPAATSRWEVATCYPGLQAIWIHRISHVFYQSRWFWAARFLSALARWFTGVEIHPGAKIGENVFIDHGMGVVIGETAEVGDGCTIYQGATLGGTSLYKGVKRHPTLGKNVIIGAGAKVLGGFTVGDGARVGSNSVVVKPVPAGETAVGIPARLIGENNHEAHMTNPSPAEAKSFNAYGVAAGDDDPVQASLEALRQQLAAQQAQIDALLQRLQSLPAA